MGIIYKFRDWGNEYHRSIITEQKIYFASPDKLNDPWDCKVIPRYDRLSKDKKRDFFISLITNLYPKKSIQDATKIYNAKLKNIQYSDYVRIYDNFVNSYGVFSATKRKDHILLWSHYAKNHEGFCIGFEETILNNDLFLEYRKIGYSIARGEIQYIEDMPVIIPDIHNLKILLDCTFFTKFVLWDYEEEIRFLLLRGANTIFKVNKKAIKEIIFGINIQSKVRSEMLECIKAHLPDVRLYQAKRTKDNYEITFEELSKDTV